MPKPLNPVLAAIVENPLLINPQSHELFRASIEHLAQDERAQVGLNEGIMASCGADMAADDRDFWGDGSGNDWRSYYRPYNVVNGVLQIPVMGTLLDRFTMSFGRWATGYKYIEMAVKRGLADGNVRGIALVIDSPGGEVSGCFELVDKLVAAGKQKEIRAFAANHAYSAAYAIASAAKTIVVAKSGGVGSIGVVTAHVEYSEALEKAGIKVTFIFAGKHKVDGNAYEKLPKAVKDRIQTRIDKIYGLFTRTVSANRAAMDEEAVRATEALTYDAEDALEVGLADKIGALDEELVIYSTELNAGDEFMATPQGNLTGQKPGTTDANGIDQATFDKGCADARAEGVAEGHAAGVKAERERTKAILDSEEGKKRPKAALAAVQTSMSAEEAVAFLGMMAEEKAEKPQATGRNHFAEAMNNGNNPNVGSGDSGEEDDEDDSPQAKSNAILGAFGAATGYGKKKSA